MSQLGLLGTRRFWPLFLTQFLGALNDNLLKSAIVIMVTYRSMTLLDLGPQQVVALSGGLFILPFFLFSGTAGQIADKVPKSSVMFWVKTAEIAIMGIAAVGFFRDDLVLLLSALTLMGFHSAFFGPAKYSILPELLTPAELVGGNALVEMGTFVAILLGTVLGGILKPGVVAWALILASVLGWLASRMIVKHPGASPKLSISLNPITPSLQTYRAARSPRSVFLSILGISWFWFLGATLLNVLPGYCKDMLHGDEHVVTFFLALFCIGIAVGSLMCERLSGGKLELGLVPLGSIGITAFVLDLFLAGVPTGFAEVEAPRLLGLGEFLAMPGGVRLSIDLLGLSLFSGLYTVPLYTMIQQRSAAKNRSRVIAANNIMNALFMVFASAMLVGLLAANFTVVEVFAVLALLNAAVAIYIYTVIPEFLLRFLSWILSIILYRVKVSNRERIPEEGAALLVCNHVTFIDWLLIASTVRRPIRFVMDHNYYKVPVLRWICRDAKVIPIAPAHQSAETLEQAFDRIAVELADGELVCIFPEGKLTKDGNLNPFRTGVERIVARSPVPVVPLALKGMWGSFFSRKDNAALRKPFRRFWSRVELIVGAPIEPANASAQHLAEVVATLGGWQIPPLATTQAAR